MACMRSEVIELDEVEVFEAAVGDEVVEGDDDLGFKLTAASWAAIDKSLDEEVVGGTGAGSVW